MLALFLLAVMTTFSCVGVKESVKLEEVLPTPSTHSSSEIIPTPVSSAETTNPQIQSAIKEECTEKDILAKSATKMLTELGLFKDNLEQTITDFQLNEMMLEQDKITSQLDEHTYLALLEKFQQKYQAEFEKTKQENQTTLKKLKQEKTAKPKLLQPKSSPKPKPTISKNTLQPGMTVYAIEKTKCEKFGEWALLYQGVVKQVFGDNVKITVKKRYAFKHHPTKKGVSKTDWFCAPKRKYCYSEVTFSAWQGKHHLNDIVEFPRANVFSANVDIVPGTDKILQKTCTRK